MPLVRFGTFELDLSSHVLSKHKSRQLLKLQPQPCKVLAFLVQRAGHVVSRKEIQRQVWGEGTFVDFEQGLNFCVKQIRETLGDNAHSPRYVETLPRRGYRFMAPVEELIGAASPVVLSPEPHHIPGTTDLDRYVHIVVLPFENFSGDPNQDSFVDGMTNALITDLTKISALRVISLATAMQYKRKHKSPRDIARKLNADLIVEGGVIRSGKRVRITVQLVQAATGMYMWAESYERELKDILVLQNEVIRTIANAIKVKLTPQEQARLASAPTVNPEAYDAYLMGRYCWNKRTEEWLKKAIEYFERAIDKEPHAALGYAGLADSYTVLGLLETLPFSVVSQKAKAAAIKALDIDESLAEVHNPLIFIRANYDRDWLAAEREFQRAIELNPNYATVYHWYALTCLSPRGQHDEAISRSKQALRLEPFSVVINAGLACCFYYARKYDEALSQSRQTLELDPNYAIAHLTLGLAYEQKGMFKEAATGFRRAVKTSGRRPTMVAALAHLYATTGRRNWAFKLLNRLREQSLQRYVSPYAIGLVYAGLGMKDQAMKYLENAFEDHSVWLIYLNVDPRFDIVSSDPRLRQLSQRLKLT